VPDGESLGSSLLLSLGEGRRSPLPGGVSVTSRREEKSQEPPVRLRDRKEKIGWTTS